MNSDHTHFDIPNNVSGWMMVRGMAKGDVLVVHPPGTASRKSKTLPKSHPRVTLVDRPDVTTPSSQRGQAAGQRVSAAGARHTMYEDDGGHAASERVAVSGARHTLYEDEVEGDDAGDALGELFSSEAAAAHTRGNDDRDANNHSNSNSDVDDDTHARPTSTSSGKHKHRASHHHRAETCEINAATPPPAEDEIPDGFCAPCCQGYVYCECRQSCERRAHECPSTLGFDEMCHVWR
jgi:hypothetical protein